MIPHSFTADSLSQSQDLASKIISSCTPEQIISACDSIDTFLHSHSSDQCRHFFSITFPVLILKLFGFTNDSSSSAVSPPQCSGWIDVASSSNDPDFSSRVFNLLSPNGCVFSSISAVDRKSLVKFVFPTERLPEWARFMLSSEKDAKILFNLCPLFKGKVKEDSIKTPGSMYQVQLNVFEYYMFWFAYYPICRAYNENNVDNLLTKKTKKDKFRLENWTYSIPRFSGNVKRGTEPKSECNLYLRLLYAYLLEFVPIKDLNVHQQPYRSSLLNYTSSHDGSVLWRAEFLVDAFVNYWLIDNDFSPLSINMCKWFGMSTRLSAFSREIPPTSGLGELVKVFVKYLNLSSTLVSSQCESDAEYSGTPKWTILDSPSVLFGSNADSKDLASVVPCASAVGSWNVWIQRPLYRYILRTFLFCPVGTSMKNASEVFSVWVCYLEPWSISMDDFAGFGELANGSTQNMGKEDLQSQNCGYSSLWQGYILSNYLYYSSLVMHFIGFAHKFLHTDPELIVQMVLKVMNILTSSKELINLIKNVNTVFHSKETVSSKSKLHSLCRFIPAIREQLQDWGDGLCESDADGSFLHENWNKNLKLFDGGENGGQHLLQLFILRSEAELQSISGANLAQNLRSLDSLKSQVNCLFGGHTIEPIVFSLEEQQQQYRDEIFMPRRVGHHALADFKYKGDWMKRPISDDEVAWLAKLLIWLSVWLNESLGLNHPKNSSGGRPKWSYVDVSGDVASNINGPMETLKTVVYAIGTWLCILAAAMVSLMRKRGLRVNLRLFASKKIIMFLLLFVVFNVLKKAFRHLIREA